MLNLEGLQSARSEKVFEFQLVADQPLLEEIGMKRFQHPPVCAKPIGPVIAAHQTGGLFEFSDVPGQTDAQNIRIVHLAKAQIFGLTKSFVETLGNP